MKFIKHIIIPFSTVLILGLIVGSLHETTNSIIKPLSIILALMCIVAVINMIYFIIYLVKKDERKNEPKQQNHVVKYSEIKETSNKKQKKKFVFTCLLVSALLTAIYMLGVVVRAFFPKEGTPAQEAEDPGWQMCLPLLVCGASVVIFGLFSEPLVDFFRAVALGIY